MTGLVSYSLTVAEENNKPYSVEWSAGIGSSHDPKQKAIMYSSKQTRRLTLKCFSEKTRHYEEINAWTESGGWLY